MYGHVYGTWGGAPVQAVSEATRAEERRKSWRIAGEADARRLSPPMFTEEDSDLPVPSGMVGPHRDAVASYIDGYRCELSRMGV